MSCQAGIKTFDRRKDDYCLYKQKRTIRTNNPKVIISLFGVLECLWGDHQGRGISARELSGQCGYEGGSEL